MLPKLPAALHWARAPRQPGPLARRRVARPGAAADATRRALRARRLPQERHGVDRNGLLAVTRRQRRGEPGVRRASRGNAACSTGSIALVARRTLGRLGAVNAN